MPLINRPAPTVISFRPRLLQFEHLAQIRGRTLQRCLHDEEKESEKMTECDGAQCVPARLLLASQNGSKVLERSLRANVELRRPS
jgi:hypothetical protein